MLQGTEERVMTVLSRQLQRLLVRIFHMKGLLTCPALPPIHRRVLPRTSPSPAVSIRAVRISLSCPLYSANSGKLLKIVLKELTKSTRHLRIEVGKSSILMFTAHAGPGCVWASIRSCLVYSQNHQANCYRIDRHVKIWLA